MNKDRKVMYVSLLSLVVAVVGVSMAYAALSTSLKIKFGTVTQSSFNWDIKLNSGIVAGVSSGTGTTVCGNATVTDSSATIDSIKLSKPGDKCTYPLEVQNKGDIDANLTSITATSPDGVACNRMEEGKLVCGNVVYSLANDSAGTSLLTSREQKVERINGVSNFYLVVSYEVLPNVSNEEVTHIGAGFTLVYGQD